MGRAGPRTYCRRWRSPSSARRPVRSGSTATTGGRPSTKTPSSVLAMNREAGTLVREIPGVHSY